MDEAKRELVRGWLLKAAHDLAAARLLAANDPPMGEIAVYHCQQAAEKAIKGFPVFYDQRVERTRDIGLLVERATSIEPWFATWSEAAERLTPFATLYRYPGPAFRPDREELEEALEDAQQSFNRPWPSCPWRSTPLPVPKVRKEEDDQRGADLDQVFGQVKPTPRAERGLRELVRCRFPKATQ